MEKDWICEITCIATKTLIVPAENKKQALERLKSGDYGDGIDVNYGSIRAQRVIRQDGKSPPPSNKKR